MRPQKKLIEIISSADCHRGVISKIFGNEYLCKIKKIDNYFVISSGTRVDDIKNKKIPFALRISAIKNGIKDGLYQDRKKLAELTLKKNDLSESHEEGNYLNTSINDISNYVLNIYQKQAKQYRWDALSKISLEGKLKSKPIQTVARGDLIAMFPMEQSNLKDVHKIYNRTKISFPFTVACLNASDMFMQDEKSHIFFFEYLKGVIPIKINEAIRRYEEFS